MAIDTRYVGGRRKVRLASYDDLLDEAEKLLAADVRTLGNWTVGQTLAHLAEVMHMSVDGAPYRASFLQRLTVGSTGRGVPQPHGSVDAGAGQQVAVRAERHVIHPTDVTGQRPAVRPSSCWSGSLTSPTAAPWTWSSSASAATASR